MLWIDQEVQPSTFHTNFTIDLCCIPLEFIQKENNGREWQSDPWHVFSKCDVWIYVCSEPDLWTLNNSWNEKAPNNNNNNNGMKVIFMTIFFFILCLVSRIRLILLFSQLWLKAIENFSVPPTQVWWSWLIMLWIEYTNFCLWKKYLVKLVNSK